MLTRIAAASVALTIFAACGGGAEAPAEGTSSSVASFIPPSPARAKRIVSLDYCADQHVVMLAERETIAAVSPHATEGFSYVRDRAFGLPTVRPRMEDVLLLEPDLVVRSYGGGPGATAMLERAGIEVLQVPYVSTLDEVFGATLAIGERLGTGERAQRLVAEAKARLSALTDAPGGQTILYLTAGGATTGPGSLVHEIILAAGHENFERQPGWRMADLERLAFETPGLVASASFGGGPAEVGAWSAVRHPIAKAQIERPASIRLDGALTACGGVFLTEAAEAMAAAGR